VPHAEKEIVKIIHIRLFGEALNYSLDQSLNTIEEIDKFLEAIFGSIKTYFELAGELVGTKQKNAESVLSYLSSMRKLDKELIKAASKDKQNLDKGVIKNEVETDCIRFLFL